MNQSGIMAKGLGLHSTYGTVREGHVRQKLELLNFQVIVEACLQVKPVELKSQNPQPATLQKAEVRNQLRVKLQEQWPGIYSIILMIQQVSIFASSQPSCPLVLYEGISP